MCGQTDTKFLDMCGQTDTKFLDNLGHRDTENADKKMGERKKKKKKVGIRSRRPLGLPAA